LVQLKKNYGVDLNLTRVYFNAVTLYTRSRRWGKINNRSSCS